MTMLADIFVACLIFTLDIFPWPVYRSNPQLYVLKIVWNFSTYTRVYTVVSIYFLNIRVSQLTMQLTLWLAPLFWGNWSYSCANIYMCIYMYICTYKYICIRMYMYVCLCMCMYVYACICLYVYVCACTSRPMYVYVRDVCVCMCNCVCTCMYMHV